MSETTTVAVTIFAGATGAAVIKLIDNIVQWFLARKSAKDAEKSSSRAAIKAAKEKATQDAIAANAEANDATQDELDAHEADFEAHKEHVKQQLDLIRDCVAILAIDQLTVSCKLVIHDRQISLYDRQRIHTMYAKAHAIGVNGDLKDLLTLVDRLPLIDPLHDNETSVTERRETV